MEAYCDICESPMVMKGEKGVSVYFSCTKCEQSWSVDLNGSGCTIMKYLWPSGMKEDSKMYREQFLPEWLKEKQHWAIMMFVAGFWDQPKKEKFMQECQELYDKWFVDHPLARRKWCQFWQAA